MILRRILPSLLIVCCFSIAFVACSKKDSPSAEAGLENSAILNLLPDNTVAFSIMENTGEAYKEFSVTPWGKAGAMQALTTLEAMPPNPATDALKPFVTGVKSAGLIGEAGKPEPIQVALFFATLNQGSSPVGVGAYLQLESSIKAQEKLTHFESLFKSEGFAVTPVKADSAQAFSVALPTLAEESKGMFTSVVFAAADSRISFGSTEALALGAFTTTPKGGIAALKSSPYFAKVVSNSRERGSEFGLTYFDVARILSGIDSILPAEAKAELGGSPKDVIPLEAISITRSMKDTLFDTAVVSLAPRTENQKAALAAVQKSRGDKLVSSSPSSSTAFIQLDGALIGSIIDQATTQLPPDEIAPFAEIIRSVRSINEFQILLKGQNGASPFPDIALVARTNDTSALSAILESEIKNSLAQSQMGMTLQEKTVDGLNVKFIPPAFGIGAYLASKDSTLVFASSEPFMKEILLPTGKEGTLTTVLSKRAQQVTASPGSLLTVYANMQKIATMIQDTQGSLSMFTGGQNLVEPADIEKIRSYGSFISSFSIDAGLIKAQTAYDLPTKTATN